MSWDMVDWIAVQALATISLVLVDAVLLFSIIYGVKSLTESQKTRDADMLIWAVEQLSSVKLQLSELLKLGHFENWTEDDFQKAMKVSHSYQRVSYLARSGLINSKHLQEMWGVSIVSTWYLLRPAILCLRRDNGEPDTAEAGAFVRKDFELFALECEKFLRRRYPKALNKTENTEGKYV